MTPKPKNILLISFDDATAPWPYKTAFKEPLRTPNLDRICQQSSTFHAAYCQASVCGPSRASFMSGKSPHQIGVFYNDDKVFEKHAPDIMWPYRLKESGYYCSSGGKVHHGYVPIPEDAHNALYSDKPKFFGVDMKIPPQIETTHLGGHKRGISLVNPKDDNVLHDARSAMSAIRFLNTYDDDTPFYREVGFYSPHVPFITPQRFKDMYSVKDFKPPKSWAAGFDNNEYADEHFPENPKLTEGRTRWWKQSVRNYFAAFSHGDFHLGRVWDALQASRHAKDTIVVILSDHGFHLGNKNRFMKTALWEQVANVPLVIYDPSQPVGQDIHDPVGLIDVGSTVLDYLDLTEIEGSPGKTLRPLIEGHSEPNRVIPTFYHENAAIRKEDYRLIRYVNGSTELYDLKNDFWQLNNLGEAHPMFAETHDSLVECCDEYGLKF